MPKKISINILFQHHIDAIFRVIEMGKVEGLNAAVLRDFERLLESLEGKGWEADFGKVTLITRKEFAKLMKLHRSHASRWKAKKILGAAIYRGNDGKTDFFGVIGDLRGRLESRPQNFEHD